MKVVNKRIEKHVPVMQSNTTVKYYGGLVVWFIPTTHLTLLFSASGSQYLTRLTTVGNECVQYVYLINHLAGTHTFWD